MKLVELLINEVLMAAAVPGSWANISGRFYWFKGYSLYLWRIHGVNRRISLMGKAG
jgi:hypothetical protein